MLLHDQLSHLVEQEVIMALHLKTGQLTFSLMPSIVTCPVRLKRLPSGRFGRLQAARCCWCLERSTCRQHTMTGSQGTCKLDSAGCLQHMLPVAAGAWVQHLQLFCVRLKKQVQWVLLYLKQAQCTVPDLDVLE